MRLLDLFCGAGGAAMGYHRAGFDVVGVDISPQPNYPFEFHQADAQEYLGEALDKFYPFNYVDVIHASPPCQRWSTQTRDPESHPNLLTPIRESMMAADDIPYVIENVMGAPLKDPIRLCGSSFGLGVRRHRLFESNVALMSLPCAHGQQGPQYDVYDHGKWYISSVAPVYGTGGGKDVGKWGRAMGIDWMTREELAEAIPPAYTEFIGLQLMDYLKRQAA